jgi:transposase-like protein
MYLSDLKAPPFQRCFNDNEYQYGRGYATVLEADISDKGAQRSGASPSPPVPRRETAQTVPIHRVEPRLGVEVLTQLVVDYQAGLPVADLQSRYGLSKSSVLSVLQKAGIRISKSPLSQDQIADAIRLYDSGLSIRGVAAKLNLAKTTIQNVRTRAGVTMRPAIRLPRS